MKPYYQDSAVTLYHGDCREIVPTLGRFDLLLTDPPYGIAWGRGINKQRASKQHTGILGDEDTSCRDELLAITSPTPAIVFGSFYAPFPANTKQVLVWKKPADSGLVGSVTGYRRDAEPVFLVGDWPILTVRWSSVIEHPRGMSAVTSETGHPHTKPLGLIMALLEKTDAQTVLDPFAGSGTTGRACKDLGRKCVMIEREEKYCEIAARRMEQEVLDFS